MCRSRLPCLVAVLAVILAACGGPSGTGDAVAASGDVLPQATLPRLSDGAEVDTHDLLGRPLVVNFWATWCEFCIDEMPALEEVHQQVGDEIRFIGIDREDSLEQARRLAAETGVTYDSLIDGDGSFFRAVRGRGMPTTLLVEADGTIAYRHAGPLTAEQLLQLIDDHLR